jgi:hypothetical protein
MNYKIKGLYYSKINGSRTKLIVTHLLKEFIAFNDSKFHFPIYKIQTLDPKEIYR